MPNDQLGELAIDVRRYGARGWSPRRYGRHSTSLHGCVARSLGRDGIFAARCVQTLTHVVAVGRVVVIGCFGTVDWAGSRAVIGTTDRSTRARMFVVRSGRPRSKLAFTPR